MTQVFLLWEVSLPSCTTCVTVLHHLVAEVGCIKAKCKLILKASLLRQSMLCCALSEHEILWQMCLT